MDLQTLLTSFYFTEMKLFALAEAQRRKTQHGKTKGQDLRRRLLRINLLNKYRMEREKMKKLFGLESTHKERQKPEELSYQPQRAEKRRLKKTQLEEPEPKKIKLG